jgi:hypothetical protein
MQPYTPKMSSNILDFLSIGKEKRFMSDCMLDKEESIVLNLS